MLHPQTGAGHQVCRMMDIWMTLKAAGARTAQSIWSRILSPLKALCAATKLLGAIVIVACGSAISYARDGIGMFGSTKVLRVLCRSSLSTRCMGMPAIAEFAIAVVPVLALVLVLALRRLQRCLGQPPIIWNWSGCKATNGLIHPNEIVICKRPDGSDWCLGTGLFGKVYKAVRRGTRDVAVKKLNLGKAALRTFSRDIGILEKVSRHASIVELYGACQAEPVMICMEFMEGGDLHTAFHRCKELDTHDFDWNNKGKQIALQVAQGLHFLHTSGVVHRDVKSRNVFLTPEGNAKLADAGLASTPSLF